MIFVDARVPVVFGSIAQAEADDALLLDGADQVVPTGHAVARLGPISLHAAGCLCCLPRGRIGEALGRLFQARGRGEVAFFRRVLAVGCDRAAVERALAEDPLAAAWFRLG